MSFSATNVIVDYPFPMERRYKQLAFNLVSRISLSIPKKQNLITQSFVDGSSNVRRSSQDNLSSLQRASWYIRRDTSKFLFAYGELS